MSPPSKKELDRRLNDYIPLESTDQTKDFLRHFLGILPSDGKKNLAEDISGCANNEKLRQLVQSIRTGLLIPMKAQGGKTPTEIISSPRTGVEESIENLKSLNIEPITRSSQLQIRHRCLERDGNKCLATGAYSCNHAHPKNAETTFLEAAHIIPFALGSFQIKDGEAVDRHATIWVNLRRYFPVLSTMSFTSEQINSEKNILMLDAQIHRLFGEFSLIFEATGIAHQYRIKTFPEAATIPLKALPRSRVVKFRVHKGNWELPDPRLLAIHACIGTFLHMSGQAEIIDKLLQKFEECGGLAPSGSTNIGDLLAVSSLSLLSSNVDKMSDLQKSTEKRRPTEKQGRVWPKILGTENEPSEN